MPCPDYKESLTSFDVLTGLAIMPCSDYKEGLVGFDVTYRIGNYVMF
ncbi:hypothetical protein LQZ18_11195 [Lachnospiraceae bacterium ZAX-1]